MKKTITSLTVVCLLTLPGFLVAAESTAASATEPKFDLSLFGSWVGVNGDSARFREQHQQDTPFNGGLERFWWGDSAGKGLTFELEGRALHADDYGVNLLLTKKDVGSLTFKADTYRHYYDGTVADSAYTPLIGDDVAGRLFTRRTVYSIEGVLALPNLPQLTLGYERSERTGNQNLPWGGWVRQTPPGNNWILWNNPLFRELDYQSDRLYVGLTHTIAGFNVRLRQEWEQFNGTQYHQEPGYYTDGTYVFNRIYNSMLDHTLWTTRLDATKPLRDDQLLLHFGYVFQHTDNDNNYDSDAFTPAGAVYSDEHSINFNSNTHEGSLGRHLGTADLTYHPNNDMTLFGGLKYIYGDADNTAVRNEENSGNKTGGSDGNPLTSEEIWNFQTDTIEQSLSESFRATFAQIPKTRVTLTADFEQSNIDYDWNAMIWTAGLAGESLTGQGDWRWDADTDYSKFKYGLNLRSSPSRYLSVNAHYRYKLVSADVNERVDAATKKPGDPEYEPTATTNMYYPGRLEGWDKATHVTGLTLDLKPVRYFTVRPIVEWETSNYEFNDELYGNHDTAHFDRFGYGTSLDFQIAAPVTFTFSYMMQDITTETEAKDHSSSIGTDPYTGLPNAGYYGALIDSFDGSYETFTGVLTYSRERLTASANAGLTRGAGTWDTQYFWTSFQAAYQINKNLSARAGYTYYDYEEDNNGSVNDYTANGVFVGLRYQF